MRKKFSAEELMHKWAWDFHPMQPIEQELTNKAVTGRSSFMGLTMLAGFIAFACLLVR